MSGVKANDSIWSEVPKDAGWLVITNLNRRASSGSGPVLEIGGAAVSWVDSACFPIFDLQDAIDPFGYSGPFSVRGGRPGNFIDPKVIDRHQGKHFCHDTPTIDSATLTRELIDFQGSSNKD
jgi:hypothetical protein